jgi:hypothetical protein
MAPFHIPARMFFSTFFGTVAEHAVKQDSTRQWRRGHQQHKVDAECVPIHHNYAMPRGLSKVRGTCLMQDTQLALAESLELFVATAV